MFPSASHQTFRDARSAELPVNRRRYHPAFALSGLLVMATVACSTDGGSTDAGAADGGTSVDGGGCAADGCVVGVDTTSGADVATKTTLVINEIVSKGAPIGSFNLSSSDWIELYNGDTKDVSLDGYRVWDRPEDGFGAAWPLPDGLSVPAKGYFIVYFENDLTLPDVGTPSVPKKLKKDEAAVLWAPDGTLVDLVDWIEGDAPDGQSWGRVPDGSDTFKTMSAPSPSAANQP